MTLSTERTRPVSSTSPAQVLAIVCSAVVMASLDLFIVNVALPSIAKDLHEPNLSALSWVLNGYTIVYAALLVFFGRLADRYRRDRAFLLGVAVFTVASAACAASADVGMLVAFRLVQAAGAALLTPTSLGLVLAAYEPERRHGAVRAWTAVGGFAAALGPVVGGLLVTIDWRWVFIVNVPIGVAALVVGWKRLPAVPGQAAKAPDPVGTALVTAGVALLTMGLVEGSDWGWSSGRIVVSLAAAAVLLAGFTLHTIHSRSPLIDPGLFRIRPFTGASIVALLFSVAFGAMLLSIVLWEQDVWKWSAIKSGLALSPGPAMVPFISFVVAAPLIRRYGSAVVISAGCLFFAAGFGWFALHITTHPDYLVGMLPGSILNGTGVGLTLPTMMATAAASLPPQAFATGSGAVNMIRQTGIAIGVAVLIAILGTGRGGFRLAEFQHGWIFGAAACLAAVVPAALLLRSRPTAPAA
jgi:EmrB/QacA subfamily drug resistance transporter